MHNIFALSADMAADVVFPAAFMRDAALGNMKTRQGKAAEKHQNAEQHRQQQTGNIGGDDDICIAVTAEDRNAPGKILQKNFMARHGLFGSGE